MLNIAKLFPKSSYIKIHKRVILLILLLIVAAFAVVFVGRAEPEEQEFGGKFILREYYDFPEKSIVVRHYIAV